MSKEDNEQKKVEEKLSKKVDMFGKLPDKCMVCSLDFDKKSKKMAKEWRVIVKEDPAVVRLYCPKCWDNARSLTEYVTKQQEPLATDKTSPGYGNWRYNLEKKREK